MDAVEEIKGRLSIEDVVSQYLELKRSGRNFKALSPFSQEKTASLMVSPEKQIWHDFSSGKGGDLFTFVMEVDGLDFKAALELLARQAGVDLSQFQQKSDGQSAKLKDQIYSALEMATKYYHVCLSRNKPTLDYVINQRGYTKQTISTFRLGYSPEQGDALVQFLLKKGFNQEVIQKAGLGTKRYKGFGDMFRGRLMVPLMDASGRVNGFTARILNADPNAPKYINTPQSPVYDKSRHVFGLNLAKESLRKQNYAVVVEGNLDVIASHQAGVQNVVATAGTAMTEQHLKALSRFTNDIRLAFDQDKAGLAATERAIPIASKVGVSLSIITVPEGKDPDELVKKDPDAWLRVVEEPQYAVDWIIERYKNLLDLSSAQGKRAFSDKILKVIEELSDSVEKDHYLRLTSKLLGVSVEALQQKSTNFVKLTKPRRKTLTQPQLDKEQADQIQVQNKLLALCLFLPSLRPYLDPLTADMFNEPIAKQLLQLLKSDAEISYEKLADPTDQSLLSLQEYGTILSLVFDELYKDLEVLELRYEAARLQIRRIETYVKTQKARLARAMNTANDADMERLLEAAKRLDVLLKSAKETTK